MALRIATFNAENIVRRIDFTGFRNELLRDRALRMVAVDDEQQFRLLEQARVIAHMDDKMQLCALAIAETRADILCLQEVENIDALDAFEYGYLYKLSGTGYRRKYLVSGNDGRGIDVAVMTRDETADGEEISFVDLKSHAQLSYGDLGLYDSELAAIGEQSNEKIFRRDCLEIDLRIGGRALTVFVVHFKSMGADKDGVPGRDRTMPIRMAEARAVRKIIENRFGADRARRMRWIVAGDFNDYRERVIVDGDRFSGHHFKAVTETATSFDPLLADGFSVDLTQRRDPMDRWTLFYSEGPGRQHLCQLDYILVSPRLAASNADVVPDIIRNGQPWRTPFPDGQTANRYPRIGWDRPKSSDHCPVAVTLDIQ
jgi:predicted extracellular nuclease